ncbi:MAG: T9SS type A sorting domain-containing protein [Ignavibacteriales bacterium]|nr:T9SS type A sorting domain-containing protein [Ignavibacteriales bacterium]
MKTKALTIALLFVSTALVPIDIIGRAHAQPLTMEQIRANLINNPPNSQNQLLRKQTILSLNQILQDDASRTSASVLDFYNYMMEKVRTEVRDTVKDGAVVWMMYNDGYVVKTSDVVFAFDLISGYSGWSAHLSPDLLDRIKVLFVSHSHGDHFDVSIVNRVKANGGYVVVPAEDSYMGNVPLAVYDAVTLSGLRITAYQGLHSVPLRMYEVTCPNGLKLLHTGDNQTSSYLPNIGKLDVLLLDAWINESGSSSAVVGMRKSIDKLKPGVMIPGHIMELGHDGPTRGATYEWAFEVADASVSTDVRVMAWGERFVVTKGVTSIAGGENQRNATDFVLSQNYPDPFNPSTTIDFQLPVSGYVTLKVFDILGRGVAVLVNEVKNAGSYHVSWDAANMPSGMYVYRITAGSSVFVRKMVLMK